MTFPTLTSLTLAAVIMAPASVMAAGIPAGARASDVEHLNRIFKQHTFISRRFDTRLRAATGDRTIAVFDHRIRFQEGSQCSYITYRGKRAIVCD